MIVARSESRRLPRKVLADLAGIPLIEHVFTRAKRVRADAVMLATTDREADDELVALAESSGIPSFRGPMQDVSGRVLGCAIASECSHFARLNGDSPFLDPALLQAGVDLASSGDADVVTNLCERAFPYGVAVEVVRTATFASAYEQMSDDYDREHVTAYLYSHRDQYRIECIEATDPMLAGARLVVDTEEDLANATKVARSLGASVTTADYRKVAETYLAVAGVSR